MGTLKFKCRFNVSNVVTFKSHLIHVHCLMPQNETHPTKRSLEFQEGHGVINMETMIGR